MSEQINNPCDEKRQRIGDFKFRDSSIQKDSLFLTSTEWNSLIQHVLNGYNQRKNTNIDIDDFSIYTSCENYNEIRAGEEYGNTFMSADMFNGILAKMKWLTTNGVSNTLPEEEGKFGDEYPYLRKMVPNDIIYAKYFDDLQNYANNLTHQIETTICFSGVTSSCCGCNTCVFEGGSGCNACDSDCTNAQCGGGYCGGTGDNV